MRLLPSGRGYITKEVNVELPTHDNRDCKYCDKHTRHLKVRVEAFVVYLCEPCIKAGVYATPEPQQPNPLQLLLLQPPAVANT